METHVTGLSVPGFIQGPAWIRGMLRAPGRLPLQSRTTIHRSESQNSCYDISRNDKLCYFGMSHYRGSAPWLRIVRLEHPLHMRLHFTPPEQAIQRHMGVYLTATLDYRVPICSATSKCVNTGKPAWVRGYAATPKAVHSRTQQQANNTKQ